MGQEKRITISIDDECTEEMPMIEFSSSKLIGDECDEVCESFHALDPLKFAWQIARGMVRNSAQISGGILIALASTTVTTMTSPQIKNFIG